MTEAEVRNKTGLTTRLVLASRGGDFDPFVDGRISVGHSFRYQVGVAGTQLDHIGHGEHFLSDTFRLVAFGATWKEAFEHWKSRQPKRALVTDEA